VRAVVRPEQMRKVRGARGFDVVQRQRQRQRHMGLSGFLVERHGLVPRAWR
jgi:hypothetical protein